MKKVLAIINPISGTGSKKNIPDLLGQAYNASEYELFLTYTKAAGHAEELARRASSEGYDHVIAVGGDGTVNEVARGLVGSQTALGIVPKGSGNGLARSLGLSMKSDQVIQQLVSGRRIAIDSCELNGRPFFCTCGVGFDAFISMKFAEARSPRPRHLRRKDPLDGLRYKTETYRITIGDEEATAIPSTRSSLPAPTPRNMATTPTSPPMPPCATVCSMSRCSNLSISSKPQSW